MTKITRLADLEIYQESLKLTAIIYTFTKHVLLAKEFSLIDQMKRASLSIPANISEGYGRNTKKDFAQFLSIALGSLNELVTYLDFIELHFNLPTTTFKEQYITLSKRIYSFRTYLFNFK